MAEQMVGLTVVKMAVLKAVHLGDLMAERWADKMVVL